MCGFLVSRQGCVGALNLLTVRRIGSKKSRLINALNGAMFVRKGCHDIFEFICHVKMQVLSSSATRTKTEPAASVAIGASGCSYRLFGDLLFGIRSFCRRLWTISSLYIC